MAKQLSAKQKAALREALIEIQRCREIVREMRQILASTDKPKRQP